MSTAVILTITSASGDILNMCKINISRSHLCSLEKYKNGNFISVPIRTSPSDQTHYNISLA